MFVVIKNKATLKRIYNTNKEIFDEADLELSTSNNKKTIINNKTKIIIVGTITPYSGNGFFYTSNGRMYEKVIDPILNTRLYEDYCKDKNQLSDEEINELAKKINKKGIAFLDILSAAIRIKNNAADEAIVFGVLDKKAFKRIKELRSKPLIVCNSRIAEKYAKEELLGREYFEYIKYCQYFRTYNNNLLPSWKKMFKKAGFSL